MDYAEVLRSRLRTPEERLRDARLAGSVMGRPQEPAWQPEYQQEPGLEASNPEDWVPGPGTLKAMALKVAAAAKGLGGLAMAGGAGIIRKGGREDLVAVHQTSPRKLWPYAVNNRAPTEFTAPSIAINNGRITQDFGDTSGTVTFVVRPDALDPKNVGGKVWARDVYTPRASQFEGQPASEALKSAREGEIWGDGTKRELLRTEAQRRNFDRFTDRQLVMGEGALPDSPAHELTMRMSRPFNSYKAFEESPQGADLLVQGMHPTDLQNLQAAWQGDLWKQLQSAFPYDVPADLGRGQQQFRQTMEGMIKAGAFTRKQEQAYQQFLQGYRNIPSEYAEQKLTAPIGVHGGNFAGVIIREMPDLHEAAKTAPISSSIHAMARYTEPDAINRLIQTLSARGIPAVTTRHPEEEYYLAKWLSENAK